MSEFTKEMVADAVKEALGPEIAEFRKEIEKGLKPAEDSTQKHRVNPAAVELSEAVDKALNEKELARARRPEKNQKGLALGMVARAIAVGKNTGGQPEDILKRWAQENKYYAETAEVFTEHVKALGTDTLAAGGGLVPQEVAEEIIPLLEAKSVVMSMGAMSGPISEYNKETTGPTAYWVGENQHRTASDMVFGQLKMSDKFVAAVQAVSNRLIQKADPRIDNYVMQRLTTKIALAIDLACIRGAGTQYTPQGLRYSVASGQLQNVNATVNLANVTNDLLSLPDLVDGADVPMARPGWLIHPRTKWYLMGQRDSNGNAVWQDELRQGTLLGFPYATTTQIPKTLAVSDTDESEIYFGDFMQCVVGQDAGVQVDVDRSASYWNGSSLVSAFDLNQTAIKVEQVTDFLLLHDEAFAILIDVDWSL